MFYWPYEVLVYFLDQKIIRSDQTKEWIDFKEEVGVKTDYNTGNGTVQISEEKEFCLRTEVTESQWRKIWNIGKRKRKEIKVREV